MGKFITELDISLKRGSDTVWVLNSSLIFDSSLVGWISAQEGFETDLASVPRIPVAYSLWGARAHREAVIHDYLFRTDSKPFVGFGMANRVFLEAMIVRGKPLYVRQPMFWGVCIGGYGSYHKRPVDATL